MGEIPHFGRDKPVIKCSQGVFAFSHSLVGRPHFCLSLGIILVIIPAVVSADNHQFG
jgi:hypothetical protein